MRSLLIFAFLLLAGTAQAASAAEPDSSKNFFRFKTIVIDPGHGGKDPGAHGDNALEKNVALAIGKKLRNALQSQMPEVRTIMTRTDDSFIELHRRSAIANENHANLFISIHCNSSPEGVAHSAHKQIGAMVLVYGFHRKGEQKEAIRENASIYQEKNYKQRYEGLDGNDPASMILLNAFMQKYRKLSIMFAGMIIDQFKHHDERVTIGVKEQGVLVLAHSAMPAVLIETGFINNPVEEKYLNSDEGQNEIVQSIIRSVKLYARDVNGR